MREIEEQARILADLAWNEWKRRGVKPAIIKPQLIEVAKYFLRKCLEYGVDPETIDFVHEVAEAGLTFDELKSKVDEVLVLHVADHRARLEEWAEALRREEEALERARREGRVEEVRRLEDRIKRLRESISGLKRRLEREREERAVLEKRVKELAEELKAKKVKLRFLKDYPPFYKAGMTVETADLPWAFELISAGVAEYIFPPKPEVTAPPVTAPPRRGLGYPEKKRLETRFFAELARRGIGVNEAKRFGYYQMFLDEFEDWRRELREVSSERALEAAVKLVDRLADEIERIHAAYRVKRKPTVALPAVPERCPIDGTALREVRRIPIGPIPIRLTAEEEELRARMGLPIPRFEMVEVDVPPTMKVYACEKEHLFERVNTRFVQRTPEFIYRKVIREWAKIRRVAVVPPMAFRVGFKEDLAGWLEREKGIPLSEFLRMEPEKRRQAIREWLKAKGLPSEVEFPKVERRPLELKPIHPAVLAAKTPAQKFLAWLEHVKGISISIYARMDEETKRKLREEWTNYMKRFLT